MRRYRIVLCPGDGIGPEVIDAAVRVLEVVQATGAWALGFTRFDWGHEHSRAHGYAVPRHIAALEEAS